jgi:hypothetical protein
MRPFFAMVFVGIAFAYPVLQAWTLWRCRGGWRTASFLCLVPMGPFYLWSLYKIIMPQPSGDLSGMVIMFVAPWPILYLIVLALTSEANRKAASAEKPVSP